MAIFLCIVMLFIFWDVADPDGQVPLIGIPPHKDQSSVQNTLGAIFMLCMTAFISTMFPQLLVFQIERPIFLREQANQLYSVTPYYISKLLIDLPLMLFTPALIMAITYYPIGFFRNFTAVWHCYLANELLVQTASALGLAISVLSPNLVFAQTIAPAFVMPILLFAGLMVNVSTITPILRWIQWISPMRYAFECLVVAQWSTSPSGS